MAGRGELYKRSDGKWAFRVWGGSNIVAVDGSQGYSNKSDARETLRKLMAGEYNGPISEPE